jgi:ribosomal protein L20A (L18A)
MAKNKKGVFVVKGLIKKSPERSFSVEVTAEGERHAGIMATTLLGSRHGIKSNKIKISEVKRRAND